MKTFRPFLAFLLIPLSILVSVSISFTDILAPATFSSKEDLPGKLSTGSNKVSSFQSVKNNKFVEAIRLAEQFVIKQEFIHDFSELDMSLNLSDPPKGAFTFLTILCHGNTKLNCQYRNAYISTDDSGRTWKMGFL